MSKAAERTQVSIAHLALHPSHQLTLPLPQRQLLELLKLPGNDVCADCRSRNVS